MKWLLSLLLLTTSLFCQEAPTRKITSVTYRTQLGTAVAHIELSDGSVWKWTPDSYSENYLRKWEVGDRIIIRVVNHPGFCLQNLEKPHFHPIVSLSFDSYLLFPSIKEYHSEEGLIILSNGTKWELLYDFNKRTLFHWAIGDRVISVKGIHNNNELINLDIPHENRTQIERSIEVLPYDPNRTRD